MSADVWCIKSSTPHTRSAGWAALYLFRTSGLGWCSPDSANRFTLPQRFLSYVDILCPSTRSPATFRRNPCFCTAAKNPSVARLGNSSLRSFFAAPRLSIWAFSHLVWATQWQLRYCFSASDHCLTKIRPPRILIGTHLLFSARRQTEWSSTKTSTSTSGLRSSQRRHATWWI